MKLITRTEWGARAPTRRTKAPMRGLCTGHWNGPRVTVGGQVTWDHSRCAALVRGIQSFHMNGRGWADIAYNFVVCIHGYIFEGRGIDVINAANGTNAANRNSHAVMWLTGQGNPFHEEEKLGFRFCLQHVSKSVPVSPTNALGHRDYRPTECPGNERYGWIHSGMPVTTELPQPEPDIWEIDVNINPRAVISTLACNVPGCDGFWELFADGAVHSEGKHTDDHFFGGYNNLRQKNPNMPERVFVELAPRRDGQVGYVTRAYDGWGWGFGPDRPGQYKDS